MDEQKVKSLVSGGAGQSPLGRRNIPRIDFKPDRSLIEKLPVDMVGTDMELTIYGWITPTWTSGTPVANASGLFESLVEYIKIEASSKTVKKITPKQLRFLKSFVYAKQAPSFNKVNATNLKGTTSSTFAFGTSGQKVFVSETISIPFALFLSITPELTYLDTSKHLQTNLEIQTHGFKNLVSGGNAVGFDVLDHALSFECYARTSDLDLGKPFLTFRQDYTEEVFSGANKSRKLDIQRNSKLMGMTLEVVKVNISTDVVSEIDIGEAHGVKFAIMANGQVTRSAKIRLSQLITENINHSDLIEVYTNRGYVQLAQNGDVDSAEIGSLYNSYELELDMDGDLLDFATYEYRARIHFDEVV